MPAEFGRASDLPITVFQQILKTKIMHRKIHKFDTSAVTGALFKKSKTYIIKKEIAVRRSPWITGRCRLQPHRLDCELLRHPYHRHRQLIATAPTRIQAAKALAASQSVLFMSALPKLTFFKRLLGQKVWARRLTSKFFLDPQSARSNAVKACRLADSEIFIFRA